MIVRALILAILAASPLLRAQQPVELPPQKVDILHHRIGPEQAVHLSASDVANARFIGEESVAFNVIVSANGRPESATPTTGNAQMSNVTPHLDEAQAILMARTYKPWLVDGIPTRVKVQD